MKLTPTEIEHILRWREYQQWIKSLPPSLLKPLQSERNEQCQAIGTPTVKYDNQMHRKPRASKKS